MAEKRPKMKRPATVGDLLDHIFQDKPAGKRLHEGRIWLIWDNAVGEKIAARAQPAGFRDGILTVCVDNAAWMQQLTYLKDEIIIRLNEELGEILVTSIYLKAGNPPPNATHKDTQRKKPRTLSSKEKNWVEEQASSITDPELKIIIASLMGQHLKNN